MNELSSIDRYNIETLFTTNSKTLIRDSNGKITDQGSVWDKICYIVLCFLSFGNYSVGIQYKKYCKILENACISPATKERITVQRTCKVFRQLFPNNNKLDQAATNLHSAKDKASTSVAKQQVKEAIDEILTNINYGKNSCIDNLQEINLHPRLAEAKFAIFKNVKSEILQGPPATTVHKIYDRTQKKCLAVFKVCANNSLGAANELKVWNQLRKPNRINVKKTLYAKLSIAEKETGGIFQKFIKGKTLRDATSDLKNFQVENLSDEAKEELHRIAVFDLINLNSDRHPRNFMVDEKGHLWAIDHEQLDKGSAANWKSFITKWPALCNQPFSDDMIQHINSLDVNVHCDLGKFYNIQYKLNKFYIDFLKFSIADERPVKMTLYQIYTILSQPRMAVSAYDCIYDDYPVNYEKLIEEALRDIPGLFF